MKKYIQKIKDSINKSWNNKTSKTKRLIIYGLLLAIQRVVRMVKEGKVTSINGNDIDIKADSICVHGDNPKALEFVKTIRDTLIAEGVTIKNLK